MRPVIPVIGQQQAAQQQVANQMMMGCYLSLIPVVAAKELEKLDQFGDQDQIPEQVAEKAWKITVAAMAKMGIQVQSRQPG